MPTVPAKKKTAPAASSRMLAISMTHSVGDILGPPAPDALDESDGGHGRQQGEDQRHVAQRGLLSALGEQQQGCHRSGAEELGREHAVRRGGPPHHPPQTGCKVQQQEGGNGEWHVHADRTSPTPNTAAMRDYRSATLRCRSWRASSAWTTSPLPSRSALRVPGSMLITLANAMRDAPSGSRRSCRTVPG